jgi:hypothetical protein
MTFNIGKYMQFCRTQNHLETMGNSCCVVCGKRLVNEIEVVHL